MGKRASVTLERLREAITYDPETGVCRWLIRGAHRRMPGDFAGSPSKDGRIRIRIDGTLYYRYRLAWLYMTGEWTRMNIDHINGNQADDRWVNLRDVSQRVNTQNLKNAKRGNATGLLGVHRSVEGKYVAQIRHSGRKETVGRFSTPESAYAAYVSTKRRVHPGNTL